MEAPPSLRTGPVVRPLLAPCVTKSETLVWPQWAGHPPHPARAESLSKRKRSAHGWFERYQWPQRCFGGWQHVHHQQGPSSCFRAPWLGWRCSQSSPSPCSAKARGLRKAEGPPRPVRTLRLSEGRWLAWGTERTECDGPGCLGFRKLGSPASCL